MRPEVARSFGSAVEHYVRGRPGWPPEAVEAPGIPRDSHVLDLAAGTGKLTELLALTFAGVVAVEPDAEMRAANPGADVREGTAESIPLPDGSVDAVFVAEAFHWFETAAALQEIHRVLRPGGTLVLLWNRPREESSIPAEAHELMDRLSDEPHRNLRQRFFYSGEWRDSFEGSPFGPISEAAYEHEQVLDRDSLVSYFLSQSTVTSRSPEERAEIRAELERQIPPGQYVRPLRAEVYWTRLTA